MLENKYKVSIKNNYQLQIMKSYTEELVSRCFFNYLNYKILKNYYFNNTNYVFLVREQANIILKDMIHLVVAWRHIRGYPTKGNTTYTNAKTSRKNKLLLNFRVNQFYRLFGKKKRNIFPTLVKAEYTNRLWYNVWYSEWKQASIFVQKMLDNDRKQSSFNPAILANNQTNGYLRIGKAAKIGKSKKLTKVFTIGLPIFFTRLIYYEKLPSGWDKKLILREEVNKSLGKKVKRR